MEKAFSGRGQGVSETEKRFSMGYQQMGENSRAFMVSMTSSDQTQLTLRHWNEIPNQLPVTEVFRDVL